jgi:hypothetical protein
MQQMVHAPLQVRQVSSNPETSHLAQKARNITDLAIKIAPSGINIDVFR